MTYKAIERLKYNMHVKVFHRVPGTQEVLNKYLSPFFIMYLNIIICEKIKLSNLYEYYEDSGDN